MPLMGGHECIVKLREMGVTCPVYGVSGNADEADVVAFIAAGANRVMVSH